MQPTIVTALIDDIVQAVYPDPHLIRERYVLSQSLHLLVFMAKRKPRKNRTQSKEMMRAAIKRMMEQPGT